MVAVDDLVEPCLKSTQMHTVCVTVKKKNESYCFTLKIECTIGFRKWTRIFRLIELLIETIHIRCDRYMYS